MPFNSPVNVGKAGRTYGIKIFLKKCFVKIICLPLQRAPLYPAQLAEIFLFLYSERSGKKLERIKIKC